VNSKGISSFMGRLHAHPLAWQVESAANNQPLGLISPEAVVQADLPESRLTIQIGHTPIRIFKFGHATYLPFTNLELERWSLSLNAPDLIFNTGVHTGSSCDIPAVHEAW